MRSFFTTFFVALSVVVFAQPKTPILERKIAIALSDEKLTNALYRISQEGKFSFSYNSSIIRESEKVTLRVINKSVRDVLNELFKGEMDYKEKGNHLILTKVRLNQKQTSTTVVILSGYVEDAYTKEKIAEASVYDKKSITSVVTDEYGYFRMKLEKNGEAASVAVSKQDYKDTLVTITAPGNQYLNISIAPIVKDTIVITANIVATDSVKKEIDNVESLSLPFEGEPNIKNISDTLYRDVQVSFLPFIGTNGPLSGNIINDYSINILGGYSLGTRQIELGAFFNLDRGDVKWLQLAGFGNIVGGDVYGIQAAGFFNVNGGSTIAAQGAGFANVNFKEFNGVQTAGFTNINLKSVHGVSVAGFANITRTASRGVQLAGFANVQTDTYKGSQVAGFTNFATQQIDGSQIATFFNYAGQVRGSQIGVFNYADTLGGVPIGLLSIVKHGYHKIEVSADEVFYTNLAFRSGVKQFYNILFAGMQPEQTTDNKVVWTFGYGLGTAPKLARWLDLNIDVTSQHVNKGSFTQELSQLNKIHVGLDFRLAKKLSLATGITLNGYLTKATFTDYATLFTDYEPNMLYDRTYSNNTNFKLWFGGKVGLRFL